jgi:hypothetical protein
MKAHGLSFTVKNVASQISLRVDRRFVGHVEVRSCQGAVALP